MDGIMGINFVVDLLLLLGANRICGFPSEKKRLLAASMLGALYSGACLLPSFRFLGNLLWRIVSLGVMGVIAFGCSRGALQRCGVFLLLSLALGGLALSLGKADFRTLLLSAIFLWVLCRMSIKSPPGSREYVPLEIQNGEKCLKLLALRDTGNTLTDPVTGEQALVISSWAASRLTGLTAEQIRNPLETIASHPVPGLRLIPFRTVGQGSGMMLAMWFSRVTVRGKTKGALVAFAPEDFGSQKPYQALTGGIAW